MSSLVFVLIPCLLGPLLGFGVFFIYFLVIEPNCLLFILNLLVAGGYFYLFNLIYKKLSKKYPDRF